MTNEDKFYEWWNGDEMADDLDVVKHTPLYWAMQGWEAANRQPFVKTYSGGKPNYTEPCERCGEVNPAEIHTCTPKQREWVGLTDEELEFYTEELGQGELGRGVLRAVIDFLKEKNSTSEKNIQISDKND